MAWRQLKDFIKGIWSGKEYNVSRSIIFVNEEYWIIKDFVDGAGECEVSVVWQFFSGKCRS